MLPAGQRLRRSQDFSRVVRRGLRGTSARLVLHLVPSDRSTPARAGFVVSARVGNAVTRHAVVRRLRPLVQRRLGDLDPGTDVVVRALPNAAGATSTELGRDLDIALGAARRRVKATAARRGSG